jgi:hypothetical protein
MQAAYNPFYTVKFATTQITANASYRETKRPVYPATDSTFYRFEGNTTRSLRTNLTLKNSEWFTAIANKLGSGTNKRYQANLRESGQGFADIDSFGDDGGGKSGDFGKEDPFFFDDKGGLDDKKDSFFPDDKEKEYDFDKEKDEIKDEEKGKERDEEKGEPDKEKEQKTSKPAIEPMSLIADFFGLLGKVQNFNLSYENQYGTRFENSDERPDFLYQIGLPNTLDKDFIRQWNVNDSYSASTGFPIIRNLVSDWRYSYQIQRNFSTPLANSPTTEARTTTTVWPDVRVSLSGFENIIRAQKFLSGSRLQTAYSYSERLSGQVNSDRDDTTTENNKRWYNTEALTHTLNPLIGWNGTWFGNITNSLSMNMQISENNSYTATTVKRVTQKTTYAGTVGYSFSAEQGIKFPFIKKKIYFRNQLQTDLQVSYETEVSTVDGSQQKQKDRDTNKLSTALRGSYNFSRNIRGGVSGSYDITTNNVLEENINIIKIDFWVEVIF